MGMKIKGYKQAIREFNVWKRFTDKIEKMMGEGKYAKKEKSNKKK
jgi:hypothetical protein